MTALAIDELQLRLSLTTAIEEPEQMRPQEER